MSNERRENEEIVNHWWSVTTWLARISNVLDNQSNDPTQVKHTWSIRTNTTQCVYQRLLSSLIHQITVATKDLAGSFEARRTRPLVWLFEFAKTDLIRVGYDPKKPVFGSTRRSIWIWVPQEEAGSFSISMKENFPKREAVQPVPERPDATVKRERQCGRSGTEGRELGGKGTGMGKSPKIKDALVAKAILRLAAKCGCRCR